MAEFISNLCANFYTFGVIILLLIGGIYFTVRTRFAQFRLIAQQFKAVTEKSGENGVSSFQALMVSTASRTRRLMPSKSPAAIISGLTIQLPPQAMILEKPR